MMIWWPKTDGAGGATLEYELLDTGVFSDNRYFDVMVEYAKAEQEDILIRISVSNRGPEAAGCHVLPMLWFRNTWSWGYDAGPMRDVPGKPHLRQGQTLPGGVSVIEANHPSSGAYTLYAEGEPGLIFTENETNGARLFGQPNSTPYVKDAFHRYVIAGERHAVAPSQSGTKAAAMYHVTVDPGETSMITLRLCKGMQDEPFSDFDALFAQRISEADEFYAALQRPGLSDDERNIQRQAFAGLLWSKQLYYYDVEQWLRGDPSGPPPPQARRQGRNHDWGHLNNFDVLSMPDKWEYPWYATWDLAFHCIPLALIDGDYAKRQLQLITREWYMHPNGALPAYEWAFGDVNPPVHAWAAWRVYRIDAAQTGKPDRSFLEGIFHKLLLNFTWWVNREDEDGRNVFQGGFLGLDNISLFDRSAQLPTGGHMDQSDGTAWMGFYSLEMMKIALELARENPVYQDVATKFFEHFLRIAAAMVDRGGHGISLWDPEDEFFYDAIHLSDDTIMPLRVRSLVGLMPLLAVETLEPDIMEEMADFKRRTKWFLAHRPHLSGNMASIDVPGAGQRYLTSILTREQLISILRRMLDENEFLSDHGIRSLSKRHDAFPYSITVGGQTFSIDYEPAESEAGLFGGNSNWRGPVWFPLNYLIIEALHRYHGYYGDELRVECPSGSSRLMTLEEVAADLAHRLTRLFLRDGEGRRPIFGDVKEFQHDPHWRDFLLFHEYFHGDNGAGSGASHQTGWTGLIAMLIQSAGSG